MTTTTRPLRILFCVHTPWTEKLGVSKVSIKLSEELEKRGHVCDKFSLEDAFPNGMTRLQEFFTTGLIQQKLKKHIVAKGSRYDIIQAEHNLIPYQRKNYRFNGQLIAKSNGLAHFYHDYTTRVEPQLKRKTNETGTLLGNLMRSLGRTYSKGLKAFDASIATADTVHLLSETEAKRLIENGINAEKLHVVPNGMSPAYAAAHAKSASAEERYDAKGIAFVGSWSLRKGRYEFPEIMRYVRKHLPDAQLYLLGTGVSAEKVRAEFHPDDRNGLHIEPHFEPVLLPKLLSSCKCGVFPSYIEGFGLGVLEMLGSGLPVVAWDVPGPREMILSGQNGLLVQPSNAEATASALIQILKMPDTNYHAMHQAALQVPKRFTWEKACDAFLKSLEDH